MKFNNPSADIYVPDGLPEPEAFARTTHLGIGAHQDDLEIMAWHGVSACYDRSDRWFGGITCTNGSGSARAGIYANHSDEEMMAVRREEQRKAASLGQFSMAVQLDYPSAAVKDRADASLTEDLLKVLRATRPEQVYTHNPADKHATHVAVMVAALAALRELPQGERPGRVLGCEVWRNLDWLPDEDKVALDVSERGDLAAAVMGIYDSQIAGGKRYDLATLGRWRANATYFESHAVDEGEGLALALDLTPLVADPTRDLVDYVLSFIDRFKDSVRKGLRP